MATEMETNPYQSPQAECSSIEVVDDQVVVRRMRLTIRLYRWMGYIGVAVYSIGAITLAGQWGLREEDLTLWDLPGMAMLAGFIALFATSINVGNRLASRPHGVFGRARVVGIIQAAVFFPWLTVPGVICVRNVTRYFDAYCRGLAPSSPDVTPPRIPALSR